MIDTPLISILVPNFNKATYLKDTIESLISQTYSNWECIVVDDHSTDNSWEILQEYAQRNSKFKIFKTPDNRKLGGNAARNYAIEQSKGHYIAFLDSDDIWNSDRLILAIEFLLSNNFDSIFSGSMVITSKSVIKLKSRNIREGESVFDFILSDDVFCQTSSLIMKKELAQNILFDEDLKRHQDYDFFIRAHLESPWNYFENYDVNVNWKGAEKKKINYLDCIPFYEKHWEKSKNKKIRHKYIIRITSSSVRKNYKFNLASYYLKILLKEGYKFSFKEYILFYTPFLFLQFSKLKWFIIKVFNNE